MPYIMTCTIELATYSKQRTKPKMSKKAIKEALLGGFDFLAHNINGIPSSTYCSILDMSSGTTVTLAEKGETIDYFRLTAKDFRKESAIMGTT